MPAIKIKAKKDDIEKAEEILSVTQRFSAWVVARRRLIIGVFAGLVAGSVIAWGVQAWSQSRERSAAEAYAVVMAKWPNLDPKDAATWEKIASELAAFADGDHQVYIVPGIELRERFVFGGHDFFLTRAVVPEHWFVGQVRVAQHHDAVVFGSRECCGLNDETQDK